MESHPFKSIESIYIPFYCIPPIVGSLIPVLASPDTEIPFQTLPISKIFGMPFLHEDIVRSGQKTGAGQHSSPSTRYQNLRRIGGLLPGTGCAPSWPLSGKRDGTEISRGVPIIHGISSFQEHVIHLHTYLQHSPDPWLSHTCSGMSRYRDTVPNSLRLENFRNPFSTRRRPPIGPQKRRWTAFDVLYDI